MKTFFKYLVITLTTLFFVSCSGKQENANETASIEPEVEDQSIDLFNGKDLSGWYTYQRQPEPTSEVADIPKDTKGN